MAKASNSQTIGSNESKSEYSTLPAAGLKISTLQRELEPPPHSASGGLVSRRTIMNMLVSTGASTVCATIPTPTLARTSDDTLERIADHRRIQLSVNAILNQTLEIQRELPEDCRKSFFISDRGTDVGQNDDPRWTANQSEYWTAEDNLDAIAWSFIDRPPTSVMGLLALLSYAMEYTKDGYEWPDCRHHFENGTYRGYIEERWEESLIGAAAIGLAQVSRQNA